MNESTATELKMIVERVVRPVVASARRKDRMREEMLSHVMEAYEAELDKNKDEFKALEQTKRRFGEPAPIVSQLQSSIPKGDRWIRLFETPADESMLQAAIKFAAIEGVVYFAILAASFWVSNAFGRLSASDLVTLALTTTFIPLWAGMPVWLFGIVVAMCLMEASIAKNCSVMEWPPRKVSRFISEAWSYWPVRLSMLVAPVCVISMVLIPGVRWPDNLYDWEAGTFGMVGLGACELASLSVFCAWVLAMTVEVRRKQARMWADLPIESNA